MDISYKLVKRPSLPLAVCRFVASKRIRVSHELGVLKLQSELQSITDGSRPSIVTGLITLECSFEVY